MKSTHSMSWIPPEQSRQNTRMDNLRAFHSQLLMAIHGIAETDLQRPEREGKWSIADVIAHLADLELVYAVRLRTIVAGAGGETPLPALAQDAWVERVNRREPVAELLEQLWFHRRMNLAFRERLSPEELARTGVHPDYGPINVADAFGRIERHDAKHLAQIERIKATHGLVASETPDVSGVVAGREISVTARTCIPRGRSSITPRGARIHRGRRRAASCSCFIPRGETGVMRDE